MKNWLMESLGFAAGPSPAKDVSAAEARQLLEADRAVIVLDVRTAEEFAEGHLPKAINVEWGGSRFEAQVAALDRSATYLVHCHSGIRSRQALRVIAKHGLTNLYHLRGGIAEWDAARLPVVV